MAGEEFVLGGGKGGPEPGRVVCANARRRKQAGRRQRFAIRALASAQMKPASVDIADIVRANSYFDGIGGEGMGATRRVQAFNAFDIRALAFGDPPTAISRRAWRTPWCVDPNGGDKPEFGKMRRDACLIAASKSMHKQKSWGADA